VVNINESTNFSTIIKVGDKPVMNMTANIDTARRSCNISFFILDNDLVQQNVDMVQSSINEFKAYVKEKATAIGYTIFI
jgi:hypothetical protein